MKRLLAYLLIVLGLGLTFNVNLSADIDYPYNKSVKEQYDFGTSFLRVGAYPQAEKTFQEFVRINPKSELAGSAQYWYAETFRIRMHYIKAAGAYLDGYQKYPKGNKAPINLLKLGIMMVYIGEWDQGCKMIDGVKLQYPTANQSVISKANYEYKKMCKSKNQKNKWVKISKPYENNLKIVKKEPSQTQKVASEYHYCLKKDYNGSLYDLGSANNKRPCGNDEYEIDYETYNKITDARYKIAKSKKSKNFWEENYKSTKRIFQEYLKKKRNKTQIAKAEPSQMSKTYNWFALVKHPKTNKEFIATNVSNEKDAKRIAISKCYKYVTNQLNKRGYNDCYVDLTADENKNPKIVKNIISKEKDDSNKSLVSSNNYKGLYKWNGEIVTKEIFCKNAVSRKMPKYYPEKYKLMCENITRIVKVDEPKKEEFKPENKDNEAPVIEIAEAITVNDSTYEIEGKVIDKSKKLFVQIDGETIPVKKGKFKIKRFSPVDEQLKIVALDQWGNKSKPKLVNITIDLKETELAEKLEQLNPSLIKSKSNKNRVALIIGIEKYEQTPAANFANLDAQYFYEYARKGFGIPKSNIKLLVDEDADLVKSISSINKWLPSKIKKNKTELIIFFAGHGLASNNGEELYILPQDSDPDLLSRTALSRTELFEQIISLSPKSVTMFMDTCYSGISRDEKMLLASARPIRIVANDQEGIPDNFTIFTASKLDQISSGLEEAKHGIFSYYLMKGLEGKADTNQDKKITNGELLAYMDENVSQKAAELGREQNPSLLGDPEKVLISYR